MDDALAFAPIAELATLIRRGELSPLELTDLYLERIEHYDPALNAYLAVTAERARAQARAAEAQIAAGTYLGPLHGIPLAFKDLVDVADLPTTGGSTLLRDNIAAADATVARRLFAAGVVLLGKTQLVEFAFGGTGVNHHYGTPVNPWDPEIHRLPGGSSSGSGVAVAAGLAAAALGSDTGGSVRIPSSFCGLTGLKPTFGLLPNTGVLPLDPDPRQHWAFPALCDLPDGSIVDHLEGEVAGLRLCFPREFFWDEVDAEVEAAVRASARVFADLGVYVDEISLDVLDDLAEWRSGPSTTAVEAYLYHRHNLEAHLDQFDPIVSARILDGRDTLAADFLRQLRARDELRRKARMALENIDRDDVYFPINGLCLRNTIAVNLLDLCAVSLPCGFTHDGLPIGLQLIGHPRDEARLLRLARAFEQATDYNLLTPALDDFA
ncbi:2-amino-5-chloromuconic acid deaminase [Geodia barretti]|uniref:2-amino-5-chloromuconic acid deaminase n=1 Tax=Geodia barretti TaxID=519541 RepID=A0AA35TEM8_GEOBA|nr:2-amino-5-chloromuconic acid deaminase [Geodia barretti]